MPGLFGFATLSPGADLPAPERLSALERMRAAVTHRDYTVADPPFCDARVCAGRVDTRLFQSEAQPHVAGDVRVWIDGEIYDERPAGVSDAALLAARYRDDPSFTFLREVDGFFTAVLYDAAAQEVHLVSDRCGFRHLFHAAHGGRLWWGTELKAVRELPGFEARIDPVSVEDYFAHGFFTGDRTWFAGVELVPYGTVLSFPLGGGPPRHRRYWDWSDLGNVPVPRDRRELVAEWARLFVAAVARRCRSGRVGVMLSGGLDSRAILAAIPDSISPLHAVTFGQRGSLDVSIARRAAAARGAAHHVQELGERDWLAPRFEGVWWSDGQLNLIDTHGIGGYEERREWFDINMSGFAGDLTMGGSYLRKGYDDDFGVLRSRVRRQTAIGIKMQTSYFENRLPFFDNALLEFTYAIPPRLRAKDHIYADMLLARFPRYFRAIPWQETGVPVTWPLPLAYAVKRVGAGLERALAPLGGLGVRFGRRSYSDYDAWFRRDPARSALAAIVLNKDALYPEFVPAERVRGLWQSHQRGEHLARPVGLYATFEIWLQQVMNGRLRAAPAEAVTT
ncbi:MAG: asparagine synthase-related protein [Candidatus Krumholzibacteria bacterium]|nr:asparagine synthase-related protein [Candidatus Krumholzibacteria bacterium]